MSSLSAGPSATRRFFVRQRPTLGASDTSRGMGWSTCSGPSNPCEGIMFVLEALQAKHGDCLLLHWGDQASPRLALIDGGPDTVYSQMLKPRLQEIAEERGVERLRLDLTMVSHIDDDHI